MVARPCRIHGVDLMPGIRIDCSDYPQLPLALTDEPGIFEADVEWEFVARAGVLLAGKMRWSYEGIEFAVVFTDPRFIGLLAAFDRLMVGFAVGESQFDLILPHLGMDEISDEALRLTLDGDPDKD